MSNKIINTLHASVLGATLALGAVPNVHAQKAPDAIMFNTQAEVERICALWNNIVVRDPNNVDHCDVLKIKKIKQEKEEEERENLYKTIAAIFLTTWALGVLAKTRVIPYFKRREDEKYAKEKDEYGNHGELSGVSWKEAMESTSWKSDSTNPKHTGMDHELEAKIWAIKEEKRIQRAKRAIKNNNWSKESSDWIEESESKRPVDFSDTAILPEENQSAWNIPSDWTKTVKIEIP